MTAMDNLRTKAAQSRRGFCRNSWGRYRRTDRHARRSVPICQSMFSRMLRLVHRSSWPIVSN